MSGGERKRTSIGYELITEPQLCLLDEPTSGLDSQNAFNVIRYLKNLAKTQNMTIVLTIHQPSSQITSLFDKVICMSDGEIIYNGRCDDSIKDYFLRLGVQMPKYVNPADFLIKLAAEPKLIDSNLGHSLIVKKCKS
jgi:ATP-binding cassette subfamily G (WHITE) protein 2